MAKSSCQQESLFAFDKLSIAIMIVLHINLEKSWGGKGGGEQSEALDGRTLAPDAWRDLRLCIIQKV